MGAADARHFLNRVGFGSTPEELAAIAKLDRSEAVALVLQAPTMQTLPPPADAAEFIPRSRTREMRGDSASRKDFQRELMRRSALLRGWWFEEMLRARTPADQLRERMTLFWHNHFVSSLAKVRSTAAMLRQNQLLRRHALGDFGELLHAVAKDPAMLVYLDSASNRKGSPNENFAREVMELFTLGEGHYSEQDIKEAARAFTGWSVDLETGTFLWRRHLHDDGAKTVLGRSGNFDGDAVLDILLAQPAMPEFIVARLWREFISPEPDMAEVRRIARQWRNAPGGRYEIRVPLRALFESRAFWAPENRGVLIKSPVELTVGALHTFDMRGVDGLPFVLVLHQLGQDLFAPPNVRGWPGGEVWINSSTLLARKQFLDRLVQSDRSERGGMRRDTQGRRADASDEEALRKRLQRALDEIHIDISAWLRRIDQQHLDPQQVLWALSPDGPDMDRGREASHSREGVRRLMLDPVYQLR